MTWPAVMAKGITTLSIAATMSSSQAVSTKPSEVESVLSKHPAVQDVAVFGRKIGCAAKSSSHRLFLRSEQNATAEELAQLCRDNLPDYKVPRSILFADRVPRNPAGKTLRKALH